MNYGAEEFCYITTTALQPDKSRKPGACNKCRPSTPDPVDIAEGFMWENVDDIDATSGPSLQRNYNSQANIIVSLQLKPAEGFGYGWRTNYSRRVRYTATSTLTGAYVERPSGQIVYFSQNASTGVWSTDPDVHSMLTEIQSNGSINGWTYFDEDTGDTETYNSYGNLTQIVHLGGRALTFAYDSQNELISVTDDFGRSLTFNYTSPSGATYTGNVQSVTDSAGKVWTYTYNTSNNTLTQVTAPDGSAIVYHYENSNNPELVTGEGYVPASGTEARYSWFTYDNNSRVTQGYDGGNANQTALTYNGNGAVTVVNTLSASQTQTRNYTFNIVQGMSKLASISGNCDSTCGPQSTNFDSSGDLLSETDFNGVVTNHSYSPDGAGLEVQRIEAAGTSAQRTVQTDWNETLRLPVERRALDINNNLVRREDWVYNTVGAVQVHCLIDPTNSAASGYSCNATGTAPAGVRRSTYTYCTAVDTVQCPLVGLLLTATGPRTDLTQATTYSYYLAASAVNCGTPGAACYQPGDLHTVTDAAGHVTTVASYDADGRITRLTDINGVNTDLTYTPRGWLATRTVNGATTTFTYTAYGAVASIADPDGVTTTYGYDTAHRLNKITDALGNYIVYTLDAAGDKTAEQVYDPSGTLHKGLTRTFNTLGQLTTVVDGLSNTVFNANTSTSYDANGNLIQSSDALGIQRKLGYDALNRLVSAIDNYNGSDPATQNTTTGYQYDSLDRLTQVTDPSSLATTYSYDGLSDATGQVSPDTGTTNRTFDAAGNVFTRTDAKGITATNTFDVLNRLTSTSYADTTQNVTYTYDEANSVTGCSSSYPTGRLTRIIENSVTTVYCYDAWGRVIQKQQVTAAGTDTTGYSYTAAGRLSGIVYPSGTLVSYARDGDGRIQTVTVTPPGGTASAVVSNVTYQPFGPVSGYSLGNGQAIARTYDANYRLTDLTSPAFNLHVARDSMGDITAIGNAAGANPATETYAYDPLYRLLSVTEAGGGVLESVTYNPTGDRLSKAGSGLDTGTYSYNSGTHQLNAVGNNAFSVDADGNTTAMTQAGSTYGFGYSDRNRMTIAQVAGVTVGNYTYNALGQRIQKVASSATERYDYNEASQMLGEYGITNRDYIWLDGIPVANVDTSGSASTIAYVTADQLGTPRAIATSNGTTEWQLPNQGNPWNEVSPISSGYTYNLGLPGQYFDAETGQMNWGFRTYNSGLGRSPQSDPMGLFGGQSSTYAYVGNNPLIRTDPKGLACNGQGCWTTPNERRYLEGGDYLGYYGAACSGGDSYACFAQHVAANDDFMGHLATNRLSDAIDVEAERNHQCSDKQAILNQIREDLANAYANYLPSSEDQARWPVAEDVAAFHWAVFAQFGLPPSTFGGTPLGAWAGVIAPDVWCPNCSVAAENGPW
ncbi:RHS repeat-associated core domain-containing protein [Dyella caseinilytica]|uniref:DUF6531 domain-containing protein n=1 Tax=Dyella caseinilytica TaxID=1849581 RepID=A0ABX7GWZ0_9GAMM|nr:RHS repeat-associated core domain-containing protein [Dyella caseinilytica]QRN54979.1 hypothetical protein ISN74_06445 [Dyella caseinilytica]